MGLRSIKIGDNVRLRSVHRGKPWTVRDIDPEKDELELVRGARVIVVTPAEVETEQEQETQHSNAQHKHCSCVDRDVLLRFRTALGNIVYGFGPQPSGEDALAMRLLAEQALGGTANGLRDTKPWYCPHQGHSTGECGPMCECTARIAAGTYGWTPQIELNELRAENEQLREKLKRWEAIDLGKIDAIGDRDAEIARLRAALNSHHKDLNDGSVCPACGFDGIDLPSRLA